MISFAQKDDIDEIMVFIDKEWRKGHILAKNKTFFEWMYSKEDRVDFVISKNGGVIDGILGFVPYDKSNAQISLTIWKALKSANGMIGISMLAFIENELKPRLIASPGVNPATTTAIYRYFKYEVNKMQHYYRLAKTNEFYIATIKERKIPSYFSERKAIVRRLNTFRDFEKEGISYLDNSIKKDLWYVRRRYFEHPVYKYFHFLIEGDSKLDVIMREQDVNGHKCIRVVDMLGDYKQLPLFTPALDELMTEKNYEYVDCYASSLAPELWSSAGWLNIENTEDIIPNYFAPFERKNIDLYYSCKPHEIVIMRGDGDQDRPN